MEGHCTPVHAGLRRHRYTQILSTCASSWSCLSLAAVYPFRRKGCSLLGDVLVVQPLLPQAQQFSASQHHPHMSFHMLGLNQ